MARDEDLELNDDNENNPEGKKFNKKPIIIIAILVILGTGIGVGAYFLLGNNTAATSTETTGEGEPTVPDEVVDNKKAKSEAIYVPISEPILVQIQGKKKARMLQVKISFLVRSSVAEVATQKHMPLIKNNLIMYFSAANSENLVTAEGKVALKDGALKVVQDLLKEQTGKIQVEQLLFTGFVMQ
ncbi:MAG: hypothetical protein COW84_02630 [Gammaproteobacteria bacterium CG22_combo_CG10-13_8_21_14_all_40_8]|nr:MAG: hypothetical protein COW84_02630 [Gammaproteobacteria bacterium CG22_combo_CG10-13_8_21_14_all_40_8]